MFGIDFSEILIIFGIALVVLGPEKLPKLANTIGRWVGRARSMARQFREQLEQETGGLHQGVDSLRQGVDQLRKGMDLRPTASGSAGPGAPAARADQRIRPAASPAQGADGAASPTAPQPEIRVGPSGLPEEHTDSFGLADTHPAGLAPYEPAVASPSHASASVATAPGADAPPASSAPSAAAQPGTAPAAAASAPADTAAAQSPPAQFPEPHQETFWPPDGVL